MSCGTQELARLFTISPTGLSPPMVDFPGRFGYLSKIHYGPALQPHIFRRRMVWAIPRSLAATQGVSVDFLSSGYLDVSVPRVRSTTPMYSARDYCRIRSWVSPFGHLRVKAHLAAPRRLIAALPRPSSPPVAKASTVCP